MLHSLSGVHGGSAGVNPRTSNFFVGNKGYGVRYPSPFFDVAQQYLPSNIQQLFDWCRYYFMTNPIINVACHKMAEYPVTPIVWETDDEKVRTTFESIEEMLRFRSFQVEIGLDYNAYGNAFASVMFQLDKWLECANCKRRIKVDQNRSLYKWRNSQFHLKCPHCSHTGPARQVDVYPRNLRRAHLIRWNPQNIRVKHNDETGRSVYYYVLPRKTVNDIKIGDPEVIEHLPYQFLEAARKRRALIMSPSNFYHLKRPTIAQADQGWGSPLIYPLLKDAFYLQLMKKAQESILLEHVVPMRVIFPGPATGGADPHTTFNLTNWKRKIDAEFQMWKRDNNYIPILPVNIGYQQLGGTARALILHHEFRLHAEQMLAGAGIPVEFIYGGLQWSSSNTSLRALENTFVGYNRDRLGLMRMVVGNISRHMGIAPCPFKFDRFKMADDLQRSMFYFQLNQAQKISDRRLMEEIGEDPDVEADRMDREVHKQLDNQRKMQIAAAEVQGAAQLKQSTYQAKAQALMAKAQIEAQMEAQAEAQAAGMPPEQATGAAQEAAQGSAEQQQQQQQPSAAGGSPGDAAQQVAGFPEGATAYDENASSPSQQAMPTALADQTSPISQNSGGVDMRYMASRAAAYLKNVREGAGDQAMYKEMERMATEDPMFYQLTVQLMNDSGSRQDPTNALKSPVSSKSVRDPSRQVVG